MYVDIYFHDICTFLVTNMMYGFGEEREPRDDTLELMELYVVEFITNLAKRSLQRS